MIFFNFESMVASGGGREGGARRGLDSHQKLSAMASISMATALLETAIISAKLLDKK